MKRMKAWSIRCLVAACLAASALALAGCAGAETYTPDEGTPTISSPTIGEDGVLRVGVDPSNAPLAGQTSSSSSIVGIDVDIAAALADELGLKVEVVDVGSDVETALSEGTVDIVLGVEASNTSDTYWLSDSYLATAVALFTLSEGSADIPANDASLTVAAQVSSKSAWAVANAYDQGTITTTSNLEDAFSALSSGEVDYVAADAVIGTFAAYSSELDVQVVALMEEASGYSIAVLDTNDDLKQAVANALATISDNGVIGVIEKKWLGSTLDLEAVSIVGDTASTDGDDSSDEEDSDDTDEAGSNAVSLDEVE